MNLVVEIDGRAAIPVRAIPLLTNWETMSPDVVAMALAWDDHFHQFKGLCAYSVENGVAGAAIDATWWENFPCRKLNALSEQIKATEISHEVGYDEWRSKALPVLPAGVFVWKDEFEARYYLRYGTNGTTFLLPGGDGEMSSDEQDRRVKLNYAPFVSGIDIKTCVAQGFESLSREAAIAETLPATQDDTGEAARLTGSVEERNVKDIKPWMVADPRDPIAAQPWYTPARYFARQLVEADSTILVKTLLLADKVSHSLAKVGIYKRGGKKPPIADTVLKALSKIDLD